MRSDYELRSFLHNNGFCIKKEAPHKMEITNIAIFPKMPRFFLFTIYILPPTFPFRKSFLRGKSLCFFMIHLFFLSYGDLVKKIQDVLINFFFVYLPQKFVSCAGVKFKTDVKALILIHFEKLFAFFTVSTDRVHLSA